MATAILEPEIEEAPPLCWESPSGGPEPASQRLDEFEEIYLTYRSRVWALCLRMTGNRDDAEDLTQETFIRMFQKLGTFRGESSFCTWLRRIAINVVLLRFQKASWRRETSLEELTSPDAMTCCPQTMEFGKVDGRLVGAIDRIRLQEAIEQLPPGFKAVLILHDIEGYEHAEISDIMGFSIGTSKSQLHKARAKMRELLEEAPHEEPLPRRPEKWAAPHPSGWKNRAVLQLPDRISRRYLEVVSEAA